MYKSPDLFDVPIHECGEFSDKHFQLVNELVLILKNHSGCIRDIRLGIWYDNWHFEFNEDVPPALKEFIQMWKKATDM